MVRIQGKKKIAPLSGFEPGPPDQKSSALPSELSWQLDNSDWFSWYMNYNGQNKAKIRPKDQNWCKYPNSSRYSVKIIFSTTFEKVQKMDHLNSLYSA